MGIVKTFFLCWMAFQVSHVAPESSWATGVSEALKQNPS